MRRAGVLLICVLFWASPAAASDHVRVILDVSSSMRTNDRARLATLATALLYDLARPDPTQRDTFEVIPFDPAMREWAAGAPPPVTTGARIRAAAGNRDAFVSALRSLQYAAPFTYFYPGLAAAAADFEALGPNRNDRRIVVLVTDGVPLPRTRDQEAALLQADLIPKLRQAGARLYVLAFGKQAAAEPRFFNDLVGRDGHVFVDHDGRELVETMIKIFSASFGYTAERSRDVETAVALNLDGGDQPTEAAVVAFRPERQPVAMKLDGPSMNSPRGVERAEESGAAYAVQWVLGPSPGDYQLALSGGQGQVTVLRPARLRITMEPGRPGLRLGHAMAGTPFPLRVVVSHIGRGGAPADVDLSYVVCRPGTSECSREAAPRAAGVAEANGRVYVIEPVPTDPAPGRDFEYIEIRIAATRGQAPVASALHTVAVYPAIEVAARPPVLTLPAGPEPPLGSGGRGCAPFFLESRRGPLPTRTTPTYAVRAWLVSAPADPRFAGATFMLDGTTLDTARPGSQSPWLAGMPLTPERLLGEHTLCVRLARPGSSAASTPANVEVAFGLGEMPYDTSSVMSQPLIAGVRIAPAGWVETHLSTLALSAAALVMVLLAWYGRDRPYVARDLRAGVPAGVQRSTTVATSLGPPSLLARLLGLRASRSLHTATGIVVGSVRPVNRELYQFRPARGVRLEPAVTSGLLVAHETYEARVPGDHLVAFRLEYE